MPPPENFGACTTESSISPKGRGTAVLARIEPRGRDRARKARKAATEPRKAERMHRSDRVSLLRRASRCLQIIVCRGGRLRQAAGRT